MWEGIVVALAAVQTSNDAGITTAAVVNDIVGAATFGTGIVFDSYELHSWSPGVRKRILTGLVPPG